MKILTRSNKLKRWKIAESIKTKAEAELQDLLDNSPSLIPVDEIREGVSPLVFAVREFGLPGSGNTDILAFSADGDIAIIECKLATNPESKRKVIGQTLEYAAYLWGISYDEINSRVQNLKGKNLSDLVGEAVAGGWDEENFRSGIKSSLENGSFILIIVVDEINEDLKRTIRYLNECSKSAFSIHALGMRRFQADAIEILIPYLYGAPSRPPEPKRKKWTEEEFFEVLNQNVEPKIINVVKDIYEWSKNVADRIWFGTGTETGSFTFHYLREGKTIAISVFTIYTNGNLILNYGWLSPQVDKETMEEFHKLIHEIPSFEHIPADFSKWPPIKVANAFLNQPKAIERFKEVVTWLGNKVHSQA